MTDAANRDESTAVGVYDTAVDHVKELRLGDRVVWLVGTAHVSEESVQLVEEIVSEKSPDTVLVELDARRLEALENEHGYRNLDIIQILKNKQGFFVVANLLLASIQRRMSAGTGIKPGAELKRAVEVGREAGAEIALVDRDISTTLRRAWRRMSLWDRIKLAFGLLLEEGEEVTEEVLAEMKKKDAMSVMMDELADVAPMIKEVLIDERDAYMARGIVRDSGAVSVAVVGAGHLPGIVKRLQAGDLDHDDPELDVVPPASLLARSAPWLLTLAIVSIWGIGFARGNYDEVQTSLVWWVLANGLLSALGGLIALAHPLTIVVAFLAAPLTSLNPTVGAGMVCGLVQAWLVRPRVADLSEVQDAMMSVKGVYGNRLTKVLLVFVLTSIGSSIGTFVALPYLLKTFG